MIQYFIRNGNSFCDTILSFCSSTTTSFLTSKVGESQLSPRTCLLKLVEIGDVECSKDISCRRLQQVLKFQWGRGENCDSRNLSRYSLRKGRGGTGWGWGNSTKVALILRRRVQSSCWWDSFRWHSPSWKTPLLESACGLRSTPSGHPARFPRHTTTPRDPRNSFNGPGHQISLWLLLQGRGGSCPQVRHRFVHRYAIPRTHISSSEINGNLFIRGNHCSTSKLRILQNLGQSLEMPHHWLDMPHHSLP